MQKWGVRGLFSELGEPVAFLVWWTRFTIGLPGISLEREALLTSVCPMDCFIFIFVLALGAVIALHESVLSIKGLKLGVNGCFGLWNRFWISLHVLCVEFHQFSAYKFDQLTLHSGRSLLCLRLRVLCQEVIKEVSVENCLAICHPSSLVVEIKLAQGECPESWTPWP